jgi:hypothetical protein
METIGQEIRRRLFALDAGVKKFQEDLRSLSTPGSTLRDTLDKVLIAVRALPLTAPNKPRKE